MSSVQAQELAQYRAMYIVLWRMIYIRQFYYTYKAIRKLHQVWECEQFEENEEELHRDISVRLLHFLLNIGIDRFTVKYLDSDNRLRQVKPDDFFSQLQNNYLGKEHLTQTVFYTTTDLDNQDKDKIGLNQSLTEVQLVESWRFSEETLKLIVDSFSESIVEDPAISKLGLGDWSFYRDKLIIMSILSYDEQTILYGLSQDELKSFSIIAPFILSCTSTLNLRYL